MFTWICSRAFDTIDHDILLHKLSYFTFNIPLIKLISSYLKVVKRHFYIKNKKEFTVLSCVLQDSNLGLLLFILVIRNLPVCFKFQTHTLKYMQHLNRFMIANYFRKTNNVLQWCDENILLLNLQISSLHEQ